LVEEILEEIPFSSKDSYGCIELVWIKLTPSMLIREISQLLDSYPQLIPNIPKAVETLEAYKWRHSHGKQGGKN
jgi:hypothetical protein